MSESHRLSSSCRQYPTSSYITNNVPNAAPRYPKEPLQGDLYGEGVSTIKEKNPANPVIGGNHSPKILPTMLWACFCTSPVLPAPPWTSSPSTWQRAPPGKNRPQCARFREAVS